MTDLPMSLENLLPNYEKRAIMPRRLTLLNKHH